MGVVQGKQYKYVVGVGVGREDRNAVVVVVDVKKLHMGDGAALGRTIEVCCWWGCRREYNRNLVVMVVEKQ